VTPQCRKRILPQSSLDARLGLLELLREVSFRLAQQAEAVLAEEGRRQEQGDDRQAGDGKGISVASKHSTAPFADVEVSWLERPSLAPAVSCYMAYTTIDYSAESEECHKPRQI